MMISERLNTKFRLFSGNGSGGSSGSGPSGSDTSTTTGPNSSADQQRVQELTQEYQKQLADGTMSQGTANGLVKKLEGTTKDSNGNYTTDGLKYLALKNALDNTNSSNNTVTSSSNHNTHKDNIVVQNPTPSPSPTPTPATQKITNGESKKIEDYTDEELEQAIETLEKGSNTQFGNVFKKLYENAIEKYKAELAKRRPTPTQTPEPAPVVETVAQTQPEQPFVPSSYSEITPEYVDNLAKQYKGKSSSELMDEINEGNNNAHNLSYAEQIQWEAKRSALVKAREEALKEEQQQLQQQQPIIAQTQPTQTTPAPNPTPVQTTETVPSSANTQVENEQSKQEERKPYVPHEVAYTAEGEKGNRFNRQAVADDLNKAFNNLYLIGSGNYYNPNGSANQNLYGMNNIQ